LIKNGKHLVIFPLRQMPMEIVSSVSLLFHSSSSDKITTNQQIQILQIVINYLQVKETAKTSPWSEWTSGSPARSTVPLGSSPAAHSTWTVESVDNGDDGWGAAEDTEWSSEIPRELLEWGEWEAEREAAEIAAEFATPSAPAPPPPPPPSGTSGVPPPSLPAQLEKGPLNHAAYVTQGSGDDNSILPKPDHSVINHLAASPIKGGFLSVGVTTRYKRKVSSSLLLDQVRGY
jgi:hypothetical protein